MRGSLGAQLCASAALIWAAWPGVANAQDTVVGNTPDVPAADDASAGDHGLSEIIVTAQRRTERLQDVPVAVTAIGAADLGATGATGTADLNVAVPGLNFTSGVGNGLPFIRSVGTQDNAPGNESAVSLYVDNVYYPAASSTLFEFGDIERIEVLRGPQGTLFGRNASGGVVHIVTKDPSTTSPEMAWSAGIGNYENKILDGYLSAPLSDNVGANLALTYADQSDAYGTDIVTGEEIGKGGRFGARSKIKWENGTSSVTLGGSYNERRGNYGTAYQAVGSTTPGLGYYDVESDARGLRNSGEHYVGYLNAAHSFGAVDIRSITAYQRAKVQLVIDFDASPDPLLLGDFRGDEKFFSQELQLSSAQPGPLQYTLGLYYFHGKSGLVRYLTGLAFGTPDATLSSQGEQTTDSYAGYGQASYDLTDSTTVTAGLRYTYDKRTYASGLTLEDGTQLGQPAGYDDRGNAGKLTWRLALNHKFSPDVMAYVSYNRGFKSGVFATSELAPTPTDPETLDAYEIGLKSEFLNGKARLNLAGFFYDYKDLQVQSVDQTGSQILANSSSARIYGLEVEAELAPVRNLRIFGNLAWTPKAEYRDFTNAPDTMTGGVFDASGNRTVRSPRFTGSIGAEVNIPTGSGDFVLNGNYYYNSGWIAEVDGFNRQPSYDLVNASLTYTLPGDSFYIQAWGKNLTKSEYASDIFTVIGPIYSSAPPRTYGLKIGYHF